MTPVAIDHVIPTFGFIGDDGATAVVFISDLAPNEWFRIGETTFHASSLVDEDAGKRAPEAAPVEFCQEDNHEGAEREIPVLFCDVRGFSKKSEELQGDLLTLLKSVSAALGVMAGGIVERDGAIADFQGDAALGFWGWPTELLEGPVPACRSALAIYRAFRHGVQKTDGLLFGFSIGMGVAHGRALAGQIGTNQPSTPSSREIGWLRESSWNAFPTRMDRNDS